MARRSYTVEKIINKLREVEVLLSQGSTVSEAARKIGAIDEAIIAGEENMVGGH